ncbi:hypothetical protein OEZ86_004613 [Tetradesmus obliquus]|nr:hypothetical protein OEZ86_004613 [Tetradesmus obliquus]
MEPISTRSEVDKRPLLDSRTAAVCSHVASPRPPRSPHSRKRPAWVVADWKHRVPEPPLPGPAARAGSLNSQQREKMVEERKKQLHSETPERLAATCPDELPLVLSHFTTLLHDIQDLDLAGTLGQLHHREVLQAGIAQLNGEFYGALLRAAGKQHEAEMRRANRQDAHGTLGQLHIMHHREVLQAGIAQLNGEFYGALLRAAGKQHEAEMRRANRQDAHGVMPASWLRV